jgi:hypothetical protein
LDGGEEVDVGGVGGEGDDVDHLGGGGFLERWTQEGGIGCCDSSQVGGAWRGEIEVEGQGRVGCVELEAFAVSVVFRWPRDYGVM